MQLLTNFAHVRRCVLDGPNAGLDHELTAPQDLVYRNDCESQGILNFFQYCFGNQ